MFAPRAIWHSAGDAARRSAVVGPVMLALSACAVSQSDAATDAGNEPEVAVVPADAANVGHGGRNDDATSEDARSSGTDIDATATRDSPAFPDSDVDAEADVVVHADGDGGCQCIVNDPEASCQSVTTSLECFGRMWFYDYADIVGDPCIGMRQTMPGWGPYWGERREVSYADRGLIGVWTTALDSPIYAYFYDASTKALLGAVRGSNWAGSDPLDCSPPRIGSRHITVRAGVLPDCEFSCGSGCADPNSRTLCPPPEAGTPDADAADAKATDNGMADSSEADVNSSDSSARDGSADATEAVDASTKAAAPSHRTWGDGPPSALSR